MPQHLFNLILERQTPYESCLEINTVFYDSSGFGQKMIFNSQTWHTHTNDLHRIPLNIDIIYQKHKQKLNT